MSKFNGILAECAYTVGLHGFTETEFGGGDTVAAWNGLMWVTSAILRNLGEDELADKLADSSDAGQDFVWLTETSDGSVSVKMSCNSVATPHQVHVIERDFGINMAAFEHVMQDAEPDGN